MNSNNYSEELAKHRKSIAVLEKRIKKYEANEKKLRDIIDLHKKKEGNLRNLLEIVPAPIIIIDKEYQIVGINRHIEKKIFKNRTQIIGKKIGEVINCASFFYGGYCGGGPSCNICSMKSAIKSVLDTDFPLYDAEINICFIIDGEPREIKYNVNIFPIIFRREKHIVLTMQGSIEETFKYGLEQKKDRQDVVKKDQLRNEYFANISHELKTPLNIILGVIALFEGYNDGDQSFNRYVQIMKQNSYRMLKIINNIVDIAKMDLGFFELNLRNHNIVNLVKDTTLSTVEYAKAKGIEVIFRNEIEEKIIACDEEKIERVLLNLLSNAIKYTKGAGTITVHIYEEDNCLLISVKDTGVGIPTDMLEEIFKLFRQVDSNIQNSNEGSGVGLFIVKTIVDLHNGNLTLESEVGKGSEFIIKLPSRTVCWPISMDSNYKSNSDKINVEFADI